MSRSRISESRTIDGSVWNCTMIVRSIAPSAAVTLGVIDVSGAFERSTTCRDGLGSSACAASKNTSGVISSRRSVYFVSFTTPTMRYRG